MMLRTLAGVCVIGSVAAFGGHTVGGQQDVHGCKPSTGYTWCEAHQACERQWMIACPKSNATNTTVGMPTMVCKDQAFKDQWGTCKTYKSKNWCDGKGKSAEWAKKDPSDWGNVMKACCACGGGQQVAKKTRKPTQKYTKRPSNSSRLPPVTKNMMCATNHRVSKQRFRSVQQAWKACSRIKACAGVYVTGCKKTGPYYLCGNTVAQVATLKPTTIPKPVTQLPSKPVMMDGGMMVGGTKDAHGCLSGGGYSWCELHQKCERSFETPCKAATKPVTMDGGMMVGGTKDAHGCLSGGGYSWCELHQKCERSFETPCKAANATIVTLATKLPSQPLLGGRRLQVGNVFTGSATGCVIMKQALKLVAKPIKTVRMDAGFVPVIMDGGMQLGGR